MNKLFALVIICTLLLNCKEYDHKWMSIGDSLTSSDGKEFKSGNHKGEKIIGYQSVFISKNNKSIKLKNHGYAGHSLAGNDRSIYQKIKDVNFKDHDLITIFVGTNDFKLNKPIISKDSLESFRYCYTTLVDKILKQNKNVNLYLITPLKRDNDGYNTKSINKVGLHLIDYRNEILRIGNEKQIKVIDLYYESGIHEGNLDKYTIDGLHPNNEGHFIIGNILYTRIKINKTKKRIL